MNRSSMFVLSAVLALPVALGAAASTDIPNAMWGDVKTVEGTIKSYDAAAKSFVISTGVGNDVKDMTVRINADTKFTLDGKASTAEAVLRGGTRAKVKHTDGTAASVDATSPKNP